MPKQAPQPQSAYRRLKSRIPELEEEISKLKRRQDELEERLPKRVGAVATTSSAYVFHGSPKSTPTRRPLVPAMPDTDDVTEEDAVVLPVVSIDWKQRAVDAEKSVEKLTSKLQKMEKAEESLGLELQEALELIEQLKKERTAVVSALEHKLGVAYCANDGLKNELDALRTRVAPMDNLFAAWNAAAAPRKN